MDVDRFIGWTPKTLANHTSNVRAALRWFSGQKDVPARCARLSPEWSALRERLLDLRYRANLCRSDALLLSPSHRACAGRRGGRAVEPEALTEADAKRLISKTPA
jgi:hypothetical protein